MEQLTPYNTKKVLGISYTKLVTVLAAVFALGSGVGVAGFEVHRQYGEYGANFDGRTHTIERVNDGDTAITTDGISVRILGIDAPELGECYGTESKQALESLLLGKQVRFVKDVTAEDNFNRLLRYGFVMTDHPTDDNINISTYMVKNGYARYAPSGPNKLFQVLLTNAQGEARNAQRGLHKTCVEQTDIVSQPSHECKIKGNVADGTKRKTYFYPGCPNYNTVKVERSKGEQYFCSEVRSRNRRLRSCLAMSENIAISTIRVLR